MGDEGRSFSPSLASQSATNTFALQNFPPHHSFFMATFGVKQETDWLPLPAASTETKSDMINTSPLLHPTPDRLSVTPHRRNAPPANAARTLQSGGGIAATPRERGLCAVCGDKASGSHYRVLSCEGCKGFWRRTVQRDAAAAYTCKGGALACPVTAETRGKCQKCR
jgi:hypothetical protein